MCRIFACISPSPVLLDDVLRKPLNPISKQFTVTGEGKKFYNCDGFGVTWHMDTRSEFNPSNYKLQSILSNDNNAIGPRPAAYKTTIANPQNDPVFVSLCENISSTCILAHMRAATNPPTSSTNNHPFVFGRHCFMYNGAISNFDKIRGDILKHVSRGFIDKIEGRTDTEHMGALYMTLLCGTAIDSDDVRGAENQYSASKMWIALKSAIQVLEKIQTDRGLIPDNYLNTCTGDGDSLLILAYRSGGRHFEDLCVSVTAADILNRKAFGYTELRKDMSQDEVEADLRKIRDTAKPAVIRNKNGAIDINQDIKTALQEQQEHYKLQKFVEYMRLKVQLETVVHNSGDKQMAAAFGGRNVDMQAFMATLGYEPYRKHGPHVIVGSEPTTLFSGAWYKLTNGNAIMVDIKHSGELKEPLQIKAGHISEINLKF